MAKYVLIYYNAQLGKDDSSQLLDTENFSFPKVKGAYKGEKLDAVPLVSTLNHSSISTNSFNSPEAPISEFEKKMLKFDIKPMLVIKTRSVVDGAKVFINLVCVTSEIPAISDPINGSGSGTGAKSSGHYSGCGESVKSSAGIADTSFSFVVQSHAVKSFVDAKGEEFLACTVFIAENIELYIKAAANFDELQAKVA